MMQERNHSFKEEQQAARQTSQVEDIFSFQEVRYPLWPRMKRWLPYFIQYFIGIGIGAIPLVAALLTLGNLSTELGNFLEQVAIDGYILVLIASIICCCVPRTRFVGCGLLTMVFISPVIFYSSWVAIPRPCYARYSLTCM